MAAIDLNLLPIFVAVAETSSFSAAAAKLRIPKSTVSRGVANLEDAMGVQLFHRTTRHVALSTAGTALLERSAALLAALQQSVSDLPELQAEPSGVIRVTAPIDFGSAVLADIVARFSARYSAVETRGRIVCDDMFFMRESLRAGAGIGILPTFVAAAEVTAGNLICALPRWSALAGQLWIVSPGGNHPARKVVAFRDFVVESLRSRSL